MGFRPAVGGSIWGQGLQLRSRGQGKSIGRRARQKDLARELGTKRMRQIYLLGEGRGPQLTRVDKPNGKGAQAIVHKAFPGLAGKLPDARLSTNVSAGCSRQPDNQKTGTVEQVATQDQPQSPNFWLIF